MEEKIEKLLDELKEIEKELSKTEVLNDHDLYKTLTQKYAHLASLRDLWQQYCSINKQLIENKDLLLSEKDAELIKIVREDIILLEIEKDKLEKEIKNVLIPPDPRDNRNIIMEIRAGTGGNEAAIFVANLIRMYKNYAIPKGWNIENLAATPSELDGYKEFIMSIAGKNVFRLMQFEAGTHRVQRVPLTESQGRLHTSAVTVAILLEPNEDEIQIEKKDVKVDRYRASGAGGQHVNTTDSAVRLTHLPTSIVVCCQDERSQHKNKDKAWRLLSAKVAEKISSSKKQEESNLRALQVGSGDRSERIRTYNYPQNRVTDHRIDLTLYKLDRIIDGDLDELVMSLIAKLKE